MGWFWGSPESNGGNKSEDPLRDLDPSLREFLKKESPVKYSSSSPAPTSQPPATPHSNPATPPEHLTSNSTSKAAEDTKAKVPAQSLYKDGRYAELWKTYQPQSEVEAEAKSDQEKINDVLEGYKYRKAEIGRAALENCALEQWDVNECFRSGGWHSRLTMCRAENKQLERCYMMQAKFLKALGYLSTFDRPPEVDEQIQMHADALYHRMLDQEKLIEVAKAEGKPVPSFPPLITPKSRAPKSTANAASEKTLDDNLVQASDLPASVQASLKKRLDGLNEEERRVEEMAIKAEIQAGEQVAERLGTIYERQAEERQKRQEEGKGTIGDKISSVFGFR